MRAAPGRQVEGFIDVAHFAWIHHEAFADRDNSVVPLYKTRITEYGIQSEYVSNVSNFPKTLKHLEPEGFLWRRVFDIHPPFIAFLTIDFPNDGVLKIMNIASPVSARETTLFVPLARNFDQTGSLEDVYAFNAQVFAEDQAIVEAQTPEDLPLGTDDEAHFARGSLFCRLSKGFAGNGALGLNGGNGAMRTNANRSKRPQNNRDEEAVP